MRFILLVISLSISLFAIGKYPSEIALPKTTVIKMDTQRCDDSCLANYLINGEMFSFISNFNPINNTQESIKEKYQILKSHLNLMDIGEKNAKLAVLVPKKIVGRYAESSVTSILSYLVTKSSDFEIEVFNTQDESYANMKEKIREIEDNNFSHVIAIVTAKGLNAIAEVPSNLLYFVPTLNKSGTNIRKHNIIFAGIDYEAQIERLLDYSGNSISIFYDSSVVSQNLTNIIKDKKPSNVKYQRLIKNSQSKFKRVLGDKRVDGSTVFLNTPLVRSSVIASAMTLYDKEPENILSTQINFKPLLLDLTQDRDREHMILANSITNRDYELEEYNSLFGNDIAYDWINYTTSVCMDNIVSRENKSTPVYKIGIVDNEISYDVKLYQPINSKLSLIEETSTH
jgi:hypothetical protein